MIEIFKDIAGYEGLYQVSNFGNVRSMKYEKTRILKPHKAGGGYLIVGLWKEGKGKNHFVHRLVAQAFIENPYNLPEVNHIDENKANNHVENLEWCDHIYNMTYGTRTERCSKKVLQLTLDGKIVREWESTMECGRNGFCQAAVVMCCNGKRKTHKGFRWVYAEDYYNLVNLQQRITMS